MTKVLHILPHFEVGGAESLAIYIMRYLDCERFEAAAVSLYSGHSGALKTTPGQGDLTVSYLGKKPGFDRRMYARIDYTLRRFRPQVVHSHLGVLRYALPSMLYHRVPAMVHTVHNLADKEVDLPGRWVHRVGFRCGVVPVAIGQEVADSLRRVYAISEFPLIPNGIPVESYGQPRFAPEMWRRQENFSPQDVIFVCVAMLFARKNHAMLLRSFAQGPASNPRAQLVLVGHGNMGRELKKQAHTLGLGGQVRFLGLREDIPEILSAADVFVLSSDYEGIPLAVMEAMAAGKPVLGTAVGGVPELVEDGISGLLVPRGNAKGLAQAMDHLLKSTKIREIMGNAARKRAQERFDVRVMASAYGELYERILGDARA